MTGREQGEEARGTVWYPEWACVGFCICAWLMGLWTGACVLGIIWAAVS